MAYPGEVDTALLHQEPAALQLSHVPPTLNMDDDHDSFWWQPSIIKNIQLFNKYEQLSHVPHVPPLNMHRLPEDETSHNPRPRSASPTFMPSNSPREVPGPSRSRSEPPTFLPSNPPREVPGLMEDGEHVHVHDAVITGHKKAVEVCEVWVKCSEDFMCFLDTCERYEDIPPEMRTKVSSLLEALHQKSLIVRQSRAIASISTEADDNKLHALQMFEGRSTCSFKHLEDHQEPKHPSWAKGLMGTQNNVSLRCLMPLGVALEIIKNAERDRFMEDAAIEVDIGRLSHESQTTPVYWLKQQKLMSSSLAGLFGSRISTKTIEFSLNFNEQMRRIQLSPTGRDQERCDRYIKALIDALVSEKRRQMQIRDEMHPLPWEVIDVKDMGTMPIVLWIRKRQDQ